MPMKTAPPIPLGFAIFLGLLGGAFVLPQFVAGTEGGLAGAATVAITFLGCFAAAGVTGLILLVLTLRHRAMLRPGVKIIGFLPLPLLCAAAFVMAIFIRQREEDRRLHEASPTILSPTTVPTAP